VSFAIKITLDFSDSIVAVPDVECYNMWEKKLEELSNCPLCMSKISLAVFLSRFPSK
jgi:hypothetical protein